MTFAELRGRSAGPPPPSSASASRPGDRVALVATPGTGWVACLGIQYAGAVLVPINTRYTAEEAADIIGRTRAPLLFGMGRAPTSPNYPALRHIVRIRRRDDDGSWDEFLAGLQPPMSGGRRPRRRPCDR